VAVVEFVDKVVVGVVVFVANCCIVDAG